MTTPALDIRENADLTRLNSLQVPVAAKYACSVGQAASLIRALDWADERNLEVLVLGGGSNLVFAGAVDGLVIRPAFTGRKWQDITEDSATLVLAAGENWHDAVMYAARTGYRGIENLALIPGTAGAAPVQNIGAYGVELKDTLTSLTVLDRKTRRVVCFDAGDCRFGYRDSVFKQQAGRYIVLDIHLRLSRSRPLVLGYGELTHYFSDREETIPLTPLEVAEGVMSIRRRKLPDPEQMPNAGSFFKNPVVSTVTWERLKEAHEGIVGYPAEDSVKLAAGWLIDQCGWKGYRNDRVGVHSHQALVLINHTGGSGADILALAERIRQDVVERFGVHLDIEPEVIGDPA